MLSSRAPITRLQGWGPFLYVKRLLLLVERTRIKPLEDRFGPQPANGLVFQVLDQDGPVWLTGPKGEPVPLAMDDGAYNRWVARVWRPARTIAAQAPDAPNGLADMTFYDCRHTAISMALHSTLVMGPHGMNLHPLAGWAGHDIETLQRYYRHLIARYHGQLPIDLETECERARVDVEATPYKPAKRDGPQREQQQRRRARTKAGSRGHVFAGHRFNRRHFYLVRDEAPLTTRPSDDWVDPVPAFELNGQGDDVPTSHAERRRD